MLIKYVSLHIPNQVSISQGNRCVNYIPYILLFLNNIANIKDPAPLE